MKKLLNKKVAAAVLALLLALGICDLTVMETSHLKPILQNLQDTATSLFDDDAEAEGTAPLITDGVKEEAPADAQ